MFNGDELNSALITGVLILCVASAFGGWVLIEGVLWLFSHVNISINTK